MMTRRLFWKELREQGTVLAALTILGCAILVAVAIFTQSGPDSGQVNELRSFTVAGRMGLLMLTMTAGVVVGATLFAGERESQSFAWLDLLPGSRWAIWWRKVLFGAVLATIATGTMVGTAFALDIFGTGVTRPTWIVMTLTIAAIGYTWGVFGSVFAKSSLGACGLGLASSGIGAIVVYLLTMIVVGLANELFHFRLESNRFWQIVPLGAAYTMIVVPLPISAWCFTAPDRNRLAIDVPPPIRDARGVAWSALRLLTLSRMPLGVGRLLWLVRKQLLVPSLILAALSLLLGGVLLIEDVPTLFVYPGMSLILGVLVAVVVLGDEQRSEASRFWGERRISTGRWWWSKLIAGGMLTLFLSILLLLPSFIVAGTSHRWRDAPTLLATFRSGLVMDMRLYILYYIALWPLYGFVCGHLAATLFRKALVATAVGILTAGILSSVWVPSLVAGGVSIWQLVLPAVAILVVDRRLGWAWTTDRLASRSALTRLASGLVAALVLVGVGIAWRVVEIEEVPEVEDDLVFARELPTFDEKQSGRTIRRATSEYADTIGPVRQETPDEPLTKRWVGFGPQGGREDHTYIEQLPTLLRTRWPNDRADLDSWLEDAASPTWQETIHEAAQKPVGVVVDPNEYHLYSRTIYLNELQEMAPIAFGRALVRQSRGDPAAFPETLRDWLFVARSTRKTTLWSSVITSLNIETMALHTLDRWLERLNGQPDLLRRVQKILLEHERTDPFNARDIRLAQQTLSRNAILAPSRWLPQHLQFSVPGTRSTSQPTEAMETETTFVGIAWTFPWEKERLRRVIGLGNRYMNSRGLLDFLQGAPGADVIFFQVHRFSDDADNVHLNVVAARRAAILKVALRLYQHDFRRMPAKLEALVPKYLPEIPLDPFDKAPFRYRVSTGEKLEMDLIDPEPARPWNPSPEPDGDLETGFLLDDRARAAAGLLGPAACWDLPVETFDFAGAGGAPGFGFAIDRDIVDVAAGRAILWSIGPDKQDNGGFRQFASRGYVQTAGEDLIFLVPEFLKDEPKPKK